MAELSGADGDAALPAFERAELLARCGGDAALADELVALFCSEILPGAALLPGLADGGERAAEAHRLRGAALAIGAPEVAAIAARIEAGGPDDGLGPALDRLWTALAAKGSG